MIYLRGLQVEADGLPVELPERPQLNLSVRPAFIDLKSDD